MSTRYVEAQAKALAPVFKQVLAAAVAPLNERIQELEKAIADKPDFDAIVKTVVEQIPVPENGKDALQIEILPEINEEKSYPRGTYAKHKGGLFRSFEQTYGMRGWECIVDGVSDMVVGQSDERTFKASVTLSSGKVVDKEMSVPALVYKGVFKPGEYKAGDTTTWGGSLWVCEEDTSDKPGEPGSKGWRLAVKKGRDGKDGRNGKDMTKGVPIK